MWWKTSQGDYVNGAHVTALEAVEITTGQWRLRVYFQLSASTTVHGPSSFHLAGSFASREEAQEAARRLVSGYDPGS
ncbi:hypothetical protein AB0N38_10535 [Micromonospora aurantiaca]|uniref:hypothetical protein n=1 Tax=Micromonospora aurantiaca (nom. illeg.) TaxID=47850 RepID=UPI0034426502